MDILGVFLLGSNEYVYLGRKEEGSIDVERYCEPIVPIINGYLC